MGMEDEGPRVMLHFDTRFTRVKYGHPEYRRVAAALSLTSECHMAVKRSAWLQEEHMASWPGNVRREASDE
jgi:hypothetical protein